MANIFSNYNVLVFCLIFNSLQVGAQKIYYVGIPNSQMDYHASIQQKPQWCWAASIQMVLGYYRIEIDQSKIVEKTYGKINNNELPDWAASVETIHKNLNHSGIDKRGKAYIINAKVGFGAPEPLMLIEELSRKRPVVIGYRAEFGGHVVIITAVSYFETAKGPVIRSIVVRDPLPEMNIRSNGGRVEYEARTLAERIDAYWIVRVFLYNTD